jgi:hypothetical protein
LHLHFDLVGLRVGFNVEAQLLNLRLKLPHRVGRFFQFVSGGGLTNDSLVHALRHERQLDRRRRELQAQIGSGYRIVCLGVKIFLTWFFLDLSFHFKLVGEVCRFRLAITALRFLQIEFSSFDRAGSFKDFVLPEDRYFGRIQAQLASLVKLVHEEQLLPLHLATRWRIAPVQAILKLRRYIVIVKED